MPTADDLLALKLKAMRLLDPAKGPQEGDDIRQLMRILAVDVDGAIDILGRYFPRSAAGAGKQRFLLAKLVSDPAEGQGDAPRYPR